MIWTLNDGEKKQRKKSKQTTKQHIDSQKITSVHLLKRYSFFLRPLSRELLISLAYDYIVHWNLHTMSIAVHSVLSGVMIQISIPKSITIYEWA